MIWQYAHDNNVTVQNLLQKHIHVTFKLDASDYKHNLSKMDLTCDCLCGLRQAFMKKQYQCEFILTIQCQILNHASFA